MACSCFSQCFGEGGEDIVRPSKTSEQSRNVRVGTSDDRWWKSSGLKAGDKIPVTGGPNDFWLLKRAEDKPLWSFHISSDQGKDLYVAYNGNDHNVTLQSDIGAGKKKMFAILLQPENKYMLSDPTSTNRFLGVEDGKDGNLAMVDADHAIEWKIIDDSFAIGNQKKVRYIQIRDSVAIASKWITSSVDVNSPVRVNQSDDDPEEWIVSGSAAEPYSFQVPKQKYYASRTEGSKYDVLYEHNVARANLRMFWLAHGESLPRGAVLLHTPPDPHKMYVGKQNVARDQEFLQMKENVGDATGWLMDVARLDFGKEGEPDIFPPI